MRINNLFNVIWKNVQKLNVAAIAAAGLIAGVSLVMGCANPAGDDSKNLTDFVAVTNITILLGDAPYSEENNTTAPGTAINLSAAAVEPETATNKAITWSIAKAEEISKLAEELAIDADDVLLDEAGDGVEAGAGAKFDVSEDAEGNSIDIVTPNSAGMLVLQAVIANGTAAGAYTRHFVIEAVDGYERVTGVVIQQNGGDVGETLTLSPNAQVQLSAVVTPEGASNTNISWSSSNAAVATVSDGGLVIAVSVGTAVITATGADNKSDSVTVTVAAGKGVYNSADDSFLAEIDSLAEGFEWIKNEGADNGEYTIKLADNEDVGVTYKLGTGASGDINSHTGIWINLKITLKSLAEETTVTLTKTVAGAMFIIYGDNASDVPTLILDSGITLHGMENNTAPLVNAGNSTDKRANFEMRQGSKIKGNKSSSTGGVDTTYASFTMSGGSIEYNESATSAGGAHTHDFTMTGGSINNNKATSGNGGGFSGNGTIILNGGRIIYNEAYRTSGAGSPSGGGLYVHNGNLTISGDTFIGYNKSYNTANSSKGYGGGIWFYATNEEHLFQMTGGTIAGNQTAATGAGIFISGTYARFSKTGGTIYGIDDGELSNKKLESSSVTTVRAIQVGSTSGPYRDTTAGPADNLTSNNNSELN
jgi:hypothetical protein